MGFTPYGKMFNPLPAAVCRMKGLSSTSKLVYGVLCRYAGANGKAFPAVNTLANETGVSRRRVQQCLAELLEIGLLSRRGGVFEFEPHEVFSEQSFTPSRTIVREFANDRTHIANNRSPNNKENRFEDRRREKANAQVARIHRL